MNWKVFGIVAAIDLVSLRLPFHTLGLARAFAPDARYLPFLSENALALSVGLFALSVLVTACACFRRTKEVAAAFAAASIAGCIFVSPRMTLGYMFVGGITLGLATIVIWFASRIGLSVLYFLPMKRTVEPNIGQVSSEAAPSASPDEPSM